MNAQRLLAAGLFLVVILGVLGVIAYSSYEGNNQREQVYVISHNVVAGQVVGPDDFSPALFHADADQFRTAEKHDKASLVSKFRYVTSLHSGDIVRADDITTAAATVQVPVRVDVVGISVGDTIDVYADDAGTARLIGPHLTVLGTGNPLLVGVAPAESASWVALSFSDTKLAAVKSGPTDPRASAPVPVNRDDAICALAGNCSASSPRPSAPAR